MSIVIIANISSNSGIGKTNGDLLFHIKEDMNFFRDTTKGNVVLFGRKTFDSIISLRGKPLEGRINAILTNNENYESKYGEQVYTDLNRIINHSKTLTENDKTIYVAGGMEIYKSLLPHCDEVLLTHVNKHVEADIYYPIELQEELGFKAVKESEDFYSEKYDAYYKFVRYVKDNIMEGGEADDEGGG